MAEKEDKTAEAKGLRKHRKRHFNLYLNDREYDALEALANKEFREIRWQALLLIRKGLGIGPEDETQIGGSDV